MMAGVVKMVCVHGPNLTSSHKKYYMWFLRTLREEFKSSLQESDYSDGIAVVAHPHEDFIHNPIRFKFC